MKLNNKGFTLVEVLAVIVIISILAGIAIPNVLSSINSSKKATYNIMISNIITASKNLYEEVSYGGNIYKYGVDGELEDIVSILDNNIIINLQTLVSNGFLTGIDNCADEDKCINSDNSNKKILINPNTKDDIGLCEIKITKEIDINSKKVNYKVSDNNNISDINCPTNDDYLK